MYKIALANLIQIVAGDEVSGGHLFELRNLSRTLLGCVTATGADGVTVAIKVNGTTITSGSSATWNTGSNTLTVTATKGTSSKVYTVTVTKGA